MAFPCYVGMILLIAPTGSGKTSLLFDLYQNNFLQIIYIAPLRALVNEVYERAEKSELRNIFLWKNSQTIRESANNLKKKKKFFLVTTPELLDDGVFEEFPHALYVFDEIHLFYYWGEDFRYILREKVWAAAAANVNLLALTATFAASELKVFTAELFSSIDAIHFINAGNQQIKTLPDKKIFYHSSKRNLFYKRLWGNLGNGKSKILFCKKRSEVDWWRQKFKKEKTQALFCLGGAVAEFQAALKDCPGPEIIICTSALSHGVNLPQIQEVYLSYHIANIDFYWQMVGRAGRRGEKFVLHTFNSEQFNRRDLILSFFDHLFFDILGALLCKRKWKEFYSPKLPIRNAILLPKFFYVLAKKFQWFFTAVAEAVKN